MKYEEALRALKDGHLEMWVDHPKAGWERLVALDDTRNLVDIWPMHLERGGPTLFLSQVTLDGYGDQLRMAPAKSAAVISHDDAASVDDLAKFILNSAELADNLANSLRTYARIMWLPRQPEVWERYMDALRAILDFHRNVNIVEAVELLGRYERGRKRE